MAWGSNRAMVCLDTKTGKLQRFLRSRGGHPIHAGRAYFEEWGKKQWCAEDMRELIERFRSDPDSFGVGAPEAA